MALEFQFFASCPKSLEGLLFKEIAELGAQAPRETVAGVYFTGNLALAYRVCLWSRLANRVLLPLAKGSVKDAEQLYERCCEIPWQEYFRPSTRFAVDFNGTNRAIRHSQFGAQKVKDAIVDTLQAGFGFRPDVDLRQPDLRVNAHLAKGEIHIGLDLVGESMHKRGYRIEPGGAPLKENLAAALLLRAGWPSLASSGAPLIDPMCGSATLLIEAAMMAADIAPGLRRAEAQGMAFTHWPQHEEAPWQALVEEARERAQAGQGATLPKLYGFDVSAQALRAAQKNIVEAGLAPYIDTQQQDISRFVAPESVKTASGLMLCNPPYGERLGELDDLRRVYRSLSMVAKAQLPGWQLAVFSGNRDLMGEIRLRSKKKYKLFNGAIESELLLYDIAQKSAGSESDHKANNAHIYKLAWKDKPLSDGATMVFNRLAKNQKRLAKWLQAEQISCYRVYDADMPEYASAVDIYQSKIYIQEYTAPATVDKQKAEQRFNDLVTACAHFFKADNQDIFFKKRAKQKGAQQYQKSERLPTKNNYELVVQEGKAKFKINLAEYIDTGLFLDHRLLRKRIAQGAAGKTFLNLFCYTASATVQAVLAGAKESVSVDMSNTYLQWAQENFRLNNINRQRHQLVREDCFAWLKSCRQGFDMIMLDPPTFSNSKKMSGVLDIQRDHVALIKRCLEILKPGGQLFFSCNLRNFKLDTAALSAFSYTDISTHTIDQDFKQNPKIHRCWEFKV